MLQPGLLINSSAKDFFTRRPQKGNPKRLAKSVAQQQSAHVPPAAKLEAQRFQILKKTWSQNWDQNLVSGTAFRSEIPETGSKSRTGIDCENPAGLKTSRSVLGSTCSATWHNERSAQQRPNVPLHSCAPAETSAVALSCRLSRDRQCRISFTSATTAKPRAHFEDKHRCTVRQPRAARPADMFLWFC